VGSERHNYRVMIPVLQHYPGEDEDIPGCEQEFDWIHVNLWLQRISLCKIEYVYRNSSKQDLGVGLESDGSRNKN
jgi:hypothetical protein